MQLSKDRVYFSPTKKQIIFWVILVKVFTLAGMISAMTVQARAPNPIMKKKIMVTRRRRGTKDQDWSSLNCLR